MKRFIVTLDRTVVQTIQVDVVAECENDAYDFVEQNAGNYDFSNQNKGTPEYSIYNVEEAPLEPL